jgi:integrase
MALPYSEIDYQRMASDEALLCSPKTLTNAFALVKSSLKKVGYAVPDVNLPTVITPDLLFLDYEQIPVYLSAAKGKAGELASILALHSLRMSELLAITVNDVDDKYITVNKAVVRDDNNQYVQKITKTEKSTRQIPVMIPRLLELLPDNGRLVTNTPTAIEKQIRRVCEASSLPYIGCHGLRRSFASLAFHLHWDERSIMSVGGWSNMQTVHKVYIKLAQQDLIANTSSMANFYQITTEDRKPLV